MVLDTDKQEKEAPVKTHLPWLLSYLMLLPCIQMCPHSQEHPFNKSQLEYGEEFGPTQVLKPFSLLEN